jgi:predicted metalloprotease
MVLFAVCASAQDTARNPSNATASPFPTKEFVARVLGSTEDVWGELFKAMGRASYQEPTIVLFSAETHSACGLISAAAGPSYCPTDRKVYLDPAWLDELSRRVRAPPNNFGEAYLIVREISRHVQTVLGTTEKVGEQARRMDARGRNSLSVRLELQADCYTGVWAHFAQKRNLKWVN